MRELRIGLDWRHTHAPMQFGVDYHPELWTFPNAGTADEPEARWRRDAELMAQAGFNVVRLGEAVWGMCEPEEGKFQFDWLRRAMDVLSEAGMQIVIATPTSVPPLWLARKHPEILPVLEDGSILHEGTRHAACLNSDIYWAYSKTIVKEMARAVGSHPQLIAWQIDNNMGGRLRDLAFNNETRRDWHAWLKAKYDTVARLNEMMGTAFLGQTVVDWSEVPMPMKAPSVFNPALHVDWHRFCSDTAVAFIRMQVDVVREVTPEIPVTTNLRSFFPSHLNLFDTAEAIDFVSAISNANIKSKSAENALELDLMRSLKKSGSKLPDNDEGFWVSDQKAGQVNWQEVNSLVRPGVVRLFTYQAIARGADGILFYFWRQPRIGSEIFYGGVLTHDGSGENRVYKEIKEIGEELKRLAPQIKGTKVQAEVAILYSYENEWALSHPRQPNKHFKLRDHVQLFHSAFHDRNIPVDFARPTDDLSKYKLVIAPSLHLLAGGEADLLKLYVQNGGTLVSTFNSGMVDEHNMAPDNGFPHDMTDLFGLEVSEFDPIPPDHDNHLSFKGQFHTSHLHMARLWCDLIEPKGCEILGSFTRDFYAGRPAMTLNHFGSGKAVYIGTESHLPFYYDLVAWLRQLCNINSLLKVPDTVEVSMRQRDGMRVFFLLNHQNSPVRIQFYKPMHDFLTGQTFTGNYDLPPHGVLVLDEHPR
ncbi:MAG: Beta-galactosidase [Verrucomicrobiales bacterium]|nr:Beta-galactosidase [Verrucomicrobiales bacterium]